MGPKLLEHFETDDRFMFLRTSRWRLTEIFAPAMNIGFITAKDVCNGIVSSLGIETTSGQPLMICNARNITEKKEYEKILEYVSMHDQLTGVYNRVYFNEEIKRRD